MKTPSYTLYLNKQKEIVQNKLYQKRELEEMTTFHLKEICIQEKIVHGILNPLDRQEYIDLILRYRGMPETRLIKKNISDGIEKIKNILKNKIKLLPITKEEIHNPAKLVIYKDQNLSIRDQYIVQLSEEFQKKIGETNVLLIGDKKEFCGIFNLEKKNEQENYYYLTRQAELPMITLEKKNYSLLFFPQKESDYLYQTYYGEKVTPWALVQAYQVPLAYLEIRKSENTNSILSIDFGTSNTTAGAYLGHHYISVLSENDIKNKEIYLDSINIVKFEENNRREKKWHTVFPSVVSIEKIEENTEEEKKEIHYHFGYEAKQDMKSRYSDETFSLFYEMKRWSANYEKEEEVIDRYGNTAFIKRKEIIREYLLYIIRSAQRQFKCIFHNIQITCPVKVKEQFLKLFIEILPEYELEQEYQIDEGTAVLYNSISHLIEKKSYLSGEELSAMIFNCGGGTTDLTSCNFKIIDNPVSYQIKIDTIYENGDANFGGNNLTYRLLQYLKINFASYYTGKLILLEDLLPAAEEEIYSYIEQYGKGKLYEKLEEKYKEAEKIIPTCFRKYESHSRKEYYSVKNNFYFLFDLAERLKQDFFERQGRFRCNFGKESNKKEQDLFTILVPHWSLTVFQKEEWICRHDIPDFICNIKQIIWLLKGDIYEIVNRFFEEFYEKGILEEYDILKLTGQSCRIDIFRDALKEFLPGKNIRFQTSVKEEKENMELKLTCIKGAILFAEAKKSGIAQVQIHYHLPRIPYSISAYTHEKVEKVLISSLNRKQSCGFLSRNKSISRLELFLKDENGQVKYRYYYDHHLDEYRAVSYEEIREIYKEYTECIPQDDTDTIIDTEVKFFVFAANKQWGFFLVPIMRENVQLYLGKEAFYNFENNEWEIDFFNGLR